MTEILPGFAVGELERPAALRRRAACLRESAETCMEDTLRASLLDTASDLEAEARLLEYEAIQLIGRDIAGLEPVAALAPKAGS